MKRLFLLAALVFMGCSDTATYPEGFDVVGKWDAYGPGRYLFEFTRTPGGRLGGTARIQGAVAYGPEIPIHVTVADDILTFTLTVGTGTLQFVGEANGDATRIEGSVLTTLGLHELPASAVGMSLVRK